MSMVAAVLFMSILMLAGVLWDSSTRMRAADAAAYAASEAARAAGQAVGADAISGHNADLDPAAGAVAARAYLAKVGVTGTVTVSGQRVIITTQVPWDPTFVPVPGQSLTGRAEARTVRT